LQASMCMPEYYLLKSASYRGDAGPYSPKFKEITVCDPDNALFRGGDYRGDGWDTSPPTFWLGDANVNVPPPLIAHLVILLTFV